jgi:hypothetical protein
MNFAILPPLPLLLFVTFERGQKPVVLFYFNVKRKAAACRKIFEKSRFNFFRGRGGAVKDGRDTGGRGRALFMDKSGKIGTIKRG